MHGHTESFVLHDDTGNVAELIGQLGGRLRQHGDAGRGLGVLVVLAVGSGQLEAMTARVPEAGQADPLAHVGQVSTAQDRYRTVSAQRRQRLGRAVGQPRGVGVVDDLGQRSVEIEEHRGLPCRRQVQSLQAVGQFGHPAIPGADVDVVHVRDHGVGVATAQGPGRVDRDHQGESAGARVRHALLGRGDDGAAAWPHRQGAGRLDQRGAIGSIEAYAGVAQLRRERGVEPVVEVEQHGVHAARVDDAPTWAVPPSRPAVAAPVVRLVGDGQTDFLSNSRIESWLSMSSRATPILMPSASLSMSAPAS